MKRLLAPMILVVALAGSACTPPPTIVTPQGKVAYTADQVAVRVNELQNAAIQANTQGGLDIATTRLIVKFCVAADQTLQTTPSGWQATLKASFAAFSKTLPATMNPNVQLLVTSLGTIINAL